MMNRIDSNDEVIAAFLDVGQGDATVVLLPGGGRALLIDCAAGARAIVLDYLLKAEVRALDLVVITHSDLDHAGDIVDVATSFIRDFGGTIDRLAFLIDRPLGPDPGVNSRYRVLLQGLAQLLRSGVRKIDPYAGVKFHFGGVAVTMLHPTAADHCDALAAGLRNDASVVMRLEYAGRRLLLGADVQGRGWRWMVDRGEDLKADVFKFPHHGSWYTNDLSLGEVLDLVRPTDVIISVGSSNTYGHPSPDTFQMLRTRHTNLRFVCTQPTRHCHSDLAAAASQARSLLAPENQHGQSLVLPNSCPCAGTVIIRMSAANIHLSPAIEQHSQVIGLFDSPQCKL